MDPAGFGAMVIAPAARFLAFFGPFGSRAGVRSPSPPVPRPDSPSFPAR